MQLVLLRELLGYRRGALARSVPLRHAHAAARGSTGVGGRSERKRWREADALLRAASYTIQPYGLRSASGTQRMLCGVERRRSVRVAQSKAYACRAVVRRCSEQPGYTLRKEHLMPSPEVISFFGAILSAGAILTGFCGTFLSFRIQREASFYSQPSLDFAQGKAKVITIGATHFTVAFGVLICASVCSAISGLVFPLCVLSGFAWAESPRVVTYGMLLSLLLIFVYFVCELRHYDIIFKQKHV